jgi:hypothetical protein
MENYIVLQPATACWSVAKPDSIIDDNDTIQGFIDKKQLLSYYGHLISDTDCTEDSFLIEYTQSTVLDTDHNGLECNLSLVETKRLPVV